jgi:hypothetical protein
LIDVGNALVKPVRQTSPGKQQRRSCPIGIGIEAASAETGHDISKDTAGLGQRATEGRKY